MKQMCLLQWVENTPGELMYPVKSGESISNKFHRDHSFP